MSRMELTPVSPNTLFAQEVGDLASLLKPSIVILQVKPVQEWPAVLADFNRKHHIRQLQVAGQLFLLVDTFWLWDQLPTITSTPALAGYLTALQQVATSLKAPHQFQARQFSLDLTAKTQVYGVLNITDDSFYDGGRYLKPEKAIARAQAMVAHGADVIELGGQSTRKGYQEITPEAEIQRVVPVLKAIRAQTPVPIAVDTYKLPVVEAVLAAGADMINVVKPLTDEPGILTAVAQAKAGLVIMHTQDGDQYTDLLGDIRQQFATDIEQCLNAGLSKNQLVIDVGLGSVYGKNYEQEYTLLHELDYFNQLGVATLIAPSHKGFIGKLLDGLPTEQRLVPTMAIFANSAALNVNFMRAHDIEAAQQTVRIIDKIKRSFAY
ncbi:dihydropteroate synthase [Loigolactobacillus bifermentans DSM 20003]|uniref:Dihydropteroate synthase n=2 Tax=Loigolactobacillus bifermentans TaxID=1607 RepID=A0A0R1H199_9LACO|nr:dihydropteroate synthase [Loigolactobacillus bifermentans DSM 20003]